MQDFTGKVVLTTGAAGNLGEAVTRAFYDAGASLALVDNREDRLLPLFGNLDPARVLLVGGVDVTDETAVTHMTTTSINRYGRVDILCNIAGGFKMGTAVHETSLSDWEFMLNLNAKSVFLVSRAIIPHMLAQGSGKIISVAARAALEGKAKMAAYTVSKSAVIRLTEGMAAELKDNGITVNCILPGTIDTPQNRAAMPNANFDKWVAPEALADVMLFLASDGARAVTGAAVPVYGRS
ncbi:MAG TPA: SDR family oxidoreductase [Chloroflexota bacterium]|nr:SDR family oxidoreductase [Chloroflexota bacterium]